MRSSSIPRPVIDGAPKPRVRQRAVQKRALDTRRKIIEAATVEFARNGFEGASTRNIALEAGIQHTLVTYHFASKEGLWQETISTMLSEYRDSFWKRLDGLRGVDDVTTLRLNCEDFIRFSAQNVDFHKIMAHAASSPSPQLDWLIDEYLKDIFVAREKLIRSAQKSGHFVQGNPRHLEYVMIGAVTRVFLLTAEVESMMGYPPTDPRFVEEHIRICMSLFFRDPPVKRRVRKSQT